MNKKNFYLVSLGCAKNTVDSESMASLLINAGYEPVERAADAGLLIVNTCGFISPARQESLNALADLARRKKRGQKLIAAGCLTQRYGEMVVKQVPGIDGILGTRRWMDIVDLVQQLNGKQRSKDGYPEPLYHLPDSPTIGTDEKGVLRVARQGGSAYVKIADGCRRPCAFCAIPLIKGTAVSRPPDAIIAEARTLQANGVHELLLIAQDTTDYGHDLGIKDGLAHLLERLTDEVPEMPWIRVLYAYPGYVTERLMQVMAERKQVVPYLDMPLQHAHPMTLRRMRRPANMDWVHNTLKTMRSTIPGLALRTTFIVGYPGETEEEFQALMDFVEEIKFDHVGVFTFSFEPGTSSEPLGDPIPQEVKEERLQRLVTLQENHSLARNQSFVGQTQQILVEGYADGISVGRGYHDAPEIDGLIFIEGEAEVGTIVQGQITGAMVHDLTARLINP
jgi:ribosomal protein S12 methylthiotransferase